MAWNEQEKQNSADGGLSWGTVLDAGQQLITGAVDAFNFLSPIDIPSFGSSSEPGDAQRQAKDDLIWNYELDQLVQATGRFQFNPPLHDSLRMQGKNVALPNYMPSGEDNTRQNPTYYPADSIVEGYDGTELGTSLWRLGTLMGGDGTLATVPDDLGYRHAFRFLYNPTSINFQSAINTALPPNAITYAGKINFFLTEGLGVITLTLMLNRIPDVLYGPGYTPELERESYDLIKRMGTMADLEYLFRTINGAHVKFTGYGDPATFVDDSADPDADTDDPDPKKRKRNNKPTTPEESKAVVEMTGDLGLLLPTPLWLSIGPQMRYWGRVQNVQWQHQMFSRRMVPILTQVSLTFQRIMVMSDSEVKSLEKNTAYYLYSQGDIVANTEQQPDTGGGGGSDSGPGADCGKYDAVPEIENQITDPLINNNCPDKTFRNTIAAARAMKSLFPKLESVAPDARRDWETTPLGHPRGLALDIAPGPIGTRPQGAKRKMGQDVADFFEKNHKRFGVNYIIWEQQIWQNGNWSGYTGGYGTTDGHFDHVHVSFFRASNCGEGEGSTAGISRLGTYWEEKGSGCDGADAKNMAEVDGSASDEINAIIDYASANLKFDETRATVKRRNKAGQKLNNEGRNTEHSGPPETSWAADFKGTKTKIDALDEAIRTAWGITTPSSDQMQVFYKTGPEHTFRLRLLNDGKGNLHVGVRRDDDDNWTATDNSQAGG